LTYALSLFFKFADALHLEKIYRRAFPISLGRSVEFIFFWTLIFNRQK
jgi:hypothetical protein